MKLVIMVLVLGFSCFAEASVARADSMSGYSRALAQFLTALPDVPLMPGLVELSDQTVVFDKPEGRFIEVVIEIFDGSFDEIRAYYESVLPQFGWSRFEKNIFVREAERLEISFRGNNVRSFLHIVVTPRSTH